MVMGGGRILRVMGWSGRITCKTGWWKEPWRRRSSVADRRWCTDWRPSSWGSSAPVAGCKRPPEIHFNFRSFTFFDSSRWLNQSYPSTWDYPTRSYWIPLLDPPPSWIPTSSNLWLLIWLDLNVQLILTSHSVSYDWYFSLTSLPSLLLPPPPPQTGFRKDPLSESCDCGIQPIIW